MSDEDDYESSSWGPPRRHLTAALFVDQPERHVEFAHSDSDTESSQVEHRADNRIYWLDWMRILAIYLVVTYHVVQALEWIGLWCDDQKLQTVSFRCVALQIGMPLFFHISGRAQALGKPQTLAKIAWSRFLRLVVPFAVCYCLLIPPWLYTHNKDFMWTCLDVNDNRTCGDLFGNVYENQRLLSGSTSSCGLPTYVPNRYTIVCPRPDAASNVFEFIYGYWTGPYFEFNPAWLWFLPVLFIFSVSCSPLFYFGEYGKWYYFAISMAWYVGLGIVATFLLNFALMFSVFLLLPHVGTAVLVHLVPFPNGVDSKTATRRWLAVRACTLLHVVSSVGMVLNFSYADMSDQAKLIPGFLAYPLFYSQGYFSERWWPEHGATDSYRLAENGVALSIKGERGYLLVKAYQFIILFIAFICIFLGSPIGYWEFDSWPVYSASFLGGTTTYAIGYVVSTWVWIGIAESLMQAYAHDQVNPWLHEHSSASTIVVYIFHWLFIKYYSWYVIRDHFMFWADFKGLAAVSTFLFGVGGSLVIYAFLRYVPGVGCLFGL
eukprot:TRINITY_DN3460_c1_g2_i1.p1 TRINITY_DN3460_c1_g2~~TRINITY_DN3460_c1_g2_i1.p1  ORF type:complete len:547 (-),score=60.64 TRINITY_DN3460_c1_g2_i1:45-1685(-)